MLIRTRLRPKKGKRLEGGKVGWSVLCIFVEEVFQAVVFEEWEASSRAGAR